MIQPCSRFEHIERRFFVIGEPAAVNGKDTPRITGYQYLQIGLEFKIDGIMPLPEIIQLYGAENGANRAIQMAILRKKDG